MTTTPAKTTDWSDAELASAVIAYLDMLRRELAGETLNKAAVNRQLREGPLHARSRASVDYRMQNISAVLFDLQIPRIIGYLPALRVGTSVKERMIGILRDNGIAEFEAYIPTDSHEALAIRVAVLRQQPFGVVPPGSLRPAQRISAAQSFVRDPAVKAYVLQLADGTCEGCDMPAPFAGYDGFPYLEVHHVMPLASHGSDRPSNAVALCPNCHRRCHFSGDRDEFKLALYERNERLILEVPEPPDDSTQIYIDS